MRATSASRGRGGAAPAAGTAGARSWSGRRDQVSLIAVNEGYITFQRNEIKLEGDYQNIQSVL